VDPERARQLLARERARIERSLRALRNGDNGELATDPDQHLADRASETYDDAYDAGLSEQLRRELEALERAEARLAVGTYGLSIESGEPIPDERLEANPLAERTVAEQARFEA
jgi:DnaK suppressor protein